MNKAAFGKWLAVAIVATIAAIAQVENHGDKQEVPKTKKLRTTVVAETCTLPIWVDDDEDDDTVLVIFICEEKEDTLET